MDTRDATSALFNMLHWYVKPEIHLSCDLSLTREQEKMSRYIVSWQKRGFSPTDQEFTLLYLLSVPCGLCTGVLIYLLCLREAQSDTSCCFQWGLGCLKAWLRIHLTLLCCVCASQRLLYMFAGTQAIICLHFAVCSCVGRYLGLPAYLCVSAWGYSTVL